MATSEDIHSARPDIPVQTIRRHMREGAPWFPGARLIGRTWVVPLAESLDYVENYTRYARTAEGASDPPRAPAPSSPTPPEKAD
jgi:hypothetical protein